MNVSEYSAAALNILRETYRPEGVTAATFAQLLARGLPSEHWRSFGFMTFKAFLEDMERRAEISLRLDDKKALRVFFSVAQVVQADAAGRPMKFNPLRQEIWRAFVFPKPTGLRFVHRRHGTVRMGLADPPTPVDEWAQVSPIPQSAQQQWARDLFQRENPAGGAALMGITISDEPDWYSKFSAELRKIGGPLPAKWNALRSEQVAIAAQDWCQRNKLDPAIAFEQKHSAPRVADSPAGPAASPDKVRRVLLAAVNQMSTDELLNLCIPAKYLIREVSL